MITLLTVFHILVAVLLVGLVLIQDSKGSGLIGAGGGTNSLFGSGGAASFVVKLTRWVAGVFALTSIMLAYLSGQKTSSVTDTVPVAPIEAPVEAPPAAAPAAPTPSGSASTPEEKQSK